MAEPVERDARDRVLLQRNYTGESSISVSAVRQYHKCSHLPITLQMPAYGIAHESSMNVVCTEPA